MQNIEHLIAASTIGAIEQFALPHIRFDMLVTNYNTMATNADTSRVRFGQTEIHNVHRPQPIVAGNIITNTAANDGNTTGIAPMVSQILFSINIIFSFTYRK